VAQQGAAGHIKEEGLEPGRADELGTGDNPLHQLPMRMTVEPRRRVSYKPLFLQGFHLLSRWNRHREIT
jgi:hypothetical protein